MSPIRLSKIIPTLVISIASIIALQTYVLERQSKHIELNLQQTQTNLFPLVTTLKDAQISIIQVQQWLNNISATRGQDGLDNGFVEAKKSASDFLNLMQEAQILDPDNASTYKGLIKIFEPYYQSGQTMAKAYIDGGPKSGNTMKAQFNTHDTNMTLAVENMFQQLNNSIIEQFLIQHENNNTNIIYVFSFIYILMLILMIIGVRVLVVKPAAYISDQLHKISDGDFTVSIDLEDGNEFGDIAQSSNRIVEQMGKNLRDITVSGMQTSAYAHALTFSIEDAQEHFDNQTTETKNVVSAIEQLATLGNIVESKSLEASQVSSDVKNKTQLSRQLLLDSVGATNELAQRMKKAKETVSELAQSSNNITEVMSVIQGIAEQTNLLALNAAIEAARAGEQGRGFAVVADEVRNLASRTQESAQQINEMINSLQSNADKTVALITENQNQALQNAEANEQVITSLTTIFDAIDNLSTLNNTISEAASSQKEQADEVSLTIIRSNEITVQYTNSSQQFHRFSKQLGKNAKDFNKLAVNLKMF
ncbi:MAG: methyl-accepting chemotaxis protein [Saccharospirillaceae bacterium]|nr:methyl-accepting chemotaxis protein [Pseudomonadales bacterium]NRB77502.1 methyl-accepting chemotaxis protein [Saccharospirillaceae bacterium]